MALHEVRIKELVLSVDHDKRDKELFDKRVSSYLNKGWEQMDHARFKKKIDIRA